MKINQSKFGMLFSMMTLAGASIMGTWAPAAANDRAPLDLTILHINDHHSHLLPDNGADLILDGKSTRVSLGGFPRLVSKFKERSAAKKNVLKLHAGDAITGDLFFTLFKGEADAALMNEVCFDAFTFGNHEFDEGDAGLVKFLDWLNAGSCKTSVVNANIVPKLGVSPLTKKTPTDYFTPFVIKEVGGTRVGIIGIDIAVKTKNSSNPDETTLFKDEASSAQTQIDALKRQGINKIILLTYFQYRNDIELAKKLKGVDVIVGGDSHSLLGNFAGVGLNSVGPYPTRVTDKDGNRVCVVQAWQYSAVLGELNVSFDADGKVTACHGTPHLILGDSFKRKNAKGVRAELEGPAREAVLADIGNNPVLSISADDPSADGVLKQFSGRVNKLKATVIGRTADNLCVERLPGQGLSKLCTAQSMVPYGSDIATIVAHAFREMSKTSQIALQNAGGVRADVAAGDITIGDAYVLLPFANTLVQFKMTGAEIKNVLEEAYDFSIKPGGSSGGYPYAAGLRWQLDGTQPKGNRFSRLEFKGKSDQTWASLDPRKSYTVVTNSFIANGKDGYVTFSKVAKDGRITDTFLDYAQAFVEYVKKRGTLQKLPVSEYSTQSYRQPR